MHHTLPFYGRYQSHFLRAYMLLAPLTRIPLLGRFVKQTANNYARRQHGAFALNASEAESILEASTWVAVGECACRKTFHRCDAPVEAEIAVGFSKEIYADAGDNFRKVPKAEAIELLRRCREAGLMSLMMKCRGHYYAICNCCTCCCVPYRLKRNYGIEYAITRDTGIVSSYIHQVAGHRD